MITTIVVTHTVISLLTLWVCKIYWFPEDKSKTLYGICAAGVFGLIIAVYAYHCKKTYFHENALMPCGLKRFECCQETPCAFGPEAARRRLGLRRDP